ncbi:MAG: DUF2934 domain-containing protein [Bauldia sp.]|nr:DUF2934 domain-containing protein [Bauldia sp.]MCW5719061.1 DUF2934 domain-containing protein [Bauldia sp.]
MRQQDSDDRRKRVTERARHLWLEAGSPPTGPDAYRDLASELIAIEEAGASALEPVRDPGPFGEPVEESAPVANLGEFPTIVDEGEQTYPPAPPARTPPE